MVNGFDWMVSSNGKNGFVGMWKLDDFALKGNGKIVGFEKDGP